MQCAVVEISPRLVVHGGSDTISAPRGLRCEAAKGSISGRRAWPPPRGYPQMGVYVVPWAAVPKERTRRKNIASYGHSIRPFFNLSSGIVQTEETRSSRVFLAL